LVDRGALAHARHQRERPHLERSADPRRARGRRPGAYRQPLHDKPGARFIVTTPSAIHAAPETDQSALSELDRPDLMLGIAATLRSAAALPDGTLLVRADLSDTRPGKDPTPNALFRGLLFRQP
jgi:hypothetical protein